MPKAQSDMKKKTLVILIIVIQFLVIAYLSMFSILKAVEANKYREMSVVNEKQAKEQLQLMMQQIQLMMQQIVVKEQQLKECQEQEIK